MRQVQQSSLPGEPQPKTMAASSRAHLQASTNQRAHAGMLLRDMMDIVQRTLVLQQMKQGGSQRDAAVQHLSSNMHTRMRAAASVQPSVHPAFKLDALNFPSTCDRPHKLHKVCKCYSTCTPVSVLASPLANYTRMTLTKNMTLCTGGMPLWERHNSVLHDRYHAVV